MIQAGSPRVAYFNDSNLAGARASQPAMTSPNRVR